MAKRHTPVLTAEDYDQLQAQLKHLEDIPGIMDKACKVGVNCDEYRRMYEMSKEWINNCLKTWFPNGRPK